MTSNRVPPHDLVAEEALLGAMLLSGDTIADVADLCDAEDFYKPANKHLFAAVIEMFSDGEAAIDPVTVSAKLQGSGLLEAVGGPTALVSLQANAGPLKSAGKYARIVANHAVMRRLISVGGEVADIGYTNGDVEAAVDEAEQLVFRISERRSGDNVRSLQEMMHAGLDRLEALYERGDSITGVPTGYIDLDQILSGLQPGAMIVVGARPAVGKTALALGMAVHAAVDNKVPSLYFSLEMSHGELAGRILASEAKVDSTRLRNGKIQDADWHKLSHAIGRIADMPLYVDDNPNTTVMQIRSVARRIKAQHGLGLVVVDYLQLMSGRRNAENRQVEIAEMSRGLKVLARELQVPVVALSQLSRNLESRADKRPMLSDLRESGSLEQDSDVVLLMYRDEIYNPDSADRGMAEIIVAKHRNGPTGTIRLAYIDRYTRFANMARTM